LSDQVRRAVDRSGLSRYRICKLAGIDEGSFSRFMAGKVGLSLPTLDALADVLNLDVVAGAADDEIVFGPIEIPKRRS
jgi:transcriptional regulator with XRE-family HTH domain